MTLINGASKGFMKALKVFIKPLEAPQRSCENKNFLNAQEGLNCFWNLLITCNKHFQVPVEQPQFFQTQPQISKRVFSDKYASYFFISKNTV